MDLQNTAGGLNLIYLNALIDCNTAKVLKWSTVIRDHCKNLINLTNFL